jgi:hypothetical protein
MGKNTATYGPGEAADLNKNVEDLHCFTETNGVITTTMFDIPGYRVVRVLGAVYGLTVRSRNIGAGLAMVVKSLAGGELTWFTNLVNIPAFAGYCALIGALLTVCPALQS